MMQHSLRFPRFGKLWIILIVVAILVPVAAVRIVQAAATINVNGGTGTDSATCGASGSPCKTIGYAVMTRAGNGDAITVAAGTYTESVTIAKPLTITGAGQNATKIDGGNANQVLHINTGANVTIRKLTVQNGNGGPGGGIYNGGTLLLTDAAVNTNTGIASGGAFFNDGAATLNLKNVAISGNKAKTGAGIYNDGTATLDTTTINGNTASDSGGGIFNHGALTITNAVINNNSAATALGGGLYNTMATAKATFATTTLSGNSAKFGGAIANDTNGAVKVDQSTINGNTVTDIGGGIYNRTGGVVALTNSTLSGNTATPGAGGGFDSFGATGILTNVTVAGNTSVGFGNNDGISTDGNMTLRGTIVADGCGGPVTSSDYNLDIGLSCKFTGPHDQKGTNPQIGPLANNGGPTFTHALSQGSPAVDMGGAACLPTDQRGIARPQGAACDIGAFELQQIVVQPTATATTPATATATTTPASAACTPLAPGSPFADPAFQAQWQQGEALAPNFWGPPDTPPGLMEPYTEAPGGQRAVQDCDKGRMELTNPSAGGVTNGLLANELITGLLQTGDTAFQQRAAATIPIAGDPDNPGPTYAGLGTTAAALLNAAPAQTGILVSTTVAANGTITPGTATAGSGPTALATYDAATQHNVPTAFADYRTKVGLLTVGLAKSEPFLTTVKVAGAQKQVMVQVFERRVLTYTADNQPAFQVEMGNIGQHYYKWRYCTS
ncbi:MAG: choice-of-anchor Q domain-containing protein [Thermomicrobiales bacterium]